jgi:pyridoxine 4-dehydrogenase
MKDTYPLAGHDVGRIGFGAMQLPGRGVFGPPKDREVAIEVLRRAVSGGVNHIDTAQFYGPSVANELIHEALHPYGEDLVLVSKVGARRGDGGAWLAAQRPEELRGAVIENLSTLRIDRLPVVNLRRHPDSDVAFADQLDAMINIRDEGLIDGIGLSTVTIEEYQHASARLTVACVQNAYSVADRSDQDVFDACKDQGTPYVPYFPLGSAFHQQNPVLGDAVVKQIAERLGATAAQVALAWLLHLAPNVLLIPGTSSLEHLAENLATSDVTLDDSDVARLGAIE